MGQGKKREVERFWAKKDENSLKYWHKARNPVRVVFNFLVIWLAKYCPSLAVKRGMYRLVGARIGRDVSVGLGVTFDIFFPEMIEIGSNSVIGYDTVLLGHEFLVKEWRKGKVKIGKNVMVGARCLVLPGVKIGNGAKVAAYSLVNRDVKKGEMVGGIPIKTLKKS